MCTLVVAQGVFPGYPVVVAANRDERLDRPAAPPRLWPGPVPFVAPQDLVAGGSWLGLNARGMFVGITNRFGAPVDKAKKSRGEIVLQALAAPGAAALHRQWADFPGAEYNPFHLLYADASGTFVTWFDGARLQQAALGSGVHIVTERSLGGDDRARTERVRAAWKAVDVSGSPPVDVLQAMLRLHEPADPLGGTCVHLPEFNYGTRSSLVLLIAAQLKDSRWFWAEGAPGHAPFQEHPEWIKAL